MARYKLRRKISSTESEEIKIPYSSIDGAPNPDDFVDLTSEQEISGVKRFTNTNGIYVDRLHNSAGNAVYDYDGSNIRIGGLTKPLHLRGVNLRPHYMSEKNSTLKEVALLEDVPTSGADIGLGNVDNTADSNKEVLSATKLKTARTITLDTGVSATAQSFDGTKNISIPVNSIKEAYLSWGGKSISNGISPVDCAASQLHSANRFAFANPDGINIEYSNDGGETWVDYEASDEMKIKLVSGLGTTIYIGKKTYSAATVDDKVRITFTSNTISGNMHVYTYLRKLLINYNSLGASGATILVESSRIGSEDTFVTVGQYAVGGWSAWNSIPLGFVFGGSSSQTSQYRRLRLTLGITGVSTSYNSNAAIQDIYAIGDTYWAYNSKMAKSGHLYEYDYLQNATFPATVKAPAFYEGTKQLATREYADNLISGLNVSDSATSNQYVTSVSETDGKVSVTRKQIAYSEISGTPTIPTVYDSTINISINGTSNTFTLNQSSGETISITIPFYNIQYYSYGKKTASFTLAATSKYYLRIATGTVGTTSEIDITLPSGNYYYIGYWTSPYSNSSSTSYSDSISGYMASTSTSRVIATIKASSAKTAPFIFIYWQV